MSHFEYELSCTSFVIVTWEGKSFFQEDVNVSISSWMYVLSNHIIEQVIQEKHLKVFYFKSYNTTLVQIRKTMKNYNTGVITLLVLYYNIELLIFKVFKGSDKYVTLDISLKFDSLDKMKTTSSESKIKLERSWKGFITSLGFNTEVRTEKYKKARYAIVNVSKKDLSKIIREFDKFEKLPHVWASSSHKVISQISQTP